MIAQSVQSVYDQGRVYQKKKNGKQEGKDIFDICFMYINSQEGRNIESIPDEEVFGMPVFFIQVDRVGDVCTGNMGSITFDIEV